ncbi:MAG: hypothetical protein HY513_04020, partial [Candidatus Aenigmarchaeota archaeon]|nr:hypothetical protein [Candidatus Aenigmarchaeota archaeon]
MVYLTTKKIKGKDYLYIVKSVKMPNGNTEKLSKMLAGNEKKLSVKKL